MRPILFSRTQHHRDRRCKLPSTALAQPYDIWFVVVDSQVAAISISSDIYNKIDRVGSVGAIVGMLYFLF
jgi:hypothetical protein